MNANSAIKQMAKAANVYWWQIAAKIGVAESTIIRWLRMPLSAEREGIILAAIKELEKEVR